MSVFLATGSRISAGSLGAVCEVACERFHLGQQLLEVRILHRNHAAQQILQIVRLHSSVNQFVLERPRVAPVDGGNDVRFAHPCLER